MTQVNGGKSECYWLVYFELQNVTEVCQTKAVCLQHKLNQFAAVVCSVVSKHLLPAVVLRTQACNGH